MKLLKEYKYRDLHLVPSNLIHWEKEQETVKQALEWQPKRSIRNSVYISTSIGEDGFYHFGVDV